MANDKRSSKTKQLLLMQHIKTFGLHSLDFNFMALTEELPKLGM